MQSVNKIHVNNSTKLSLNDRFSSLHSVAPKPASILKRRSIAQREPRPAIVEKASVRNRTLLAQLDHKHKVRAAMQIKRKSMRVAGAQRGAIAVAGRGRTASAVLNRRNNLGNAQSAAAAARLRRAKNIAILLAQSERQARGAPAPINRRRRSASTSRGGLAGRLGVTAGQQQQQIAPRRRLNRNNFVDQPRANSRSRSLVRNNLQARAGSRTREPPVQRRGRSASRNRRAAPIPKPNIVQRRASVSGRVGRANNAPVQKRGGVAATPVRPRLGRNKAAGGPQRALPGVANGRVTKRRPSISRKAPTAAQARLLANRPKANAVPRQAPQPRGRPQSRGRQPVINQRQGKPNNRNVPQSNRSRAPAGGKAAPRSKAGAPIRGRKAPANQAGKPRAAAVPSKTREQLDKELDQYMVNRSDM